MQETLLKYGWKLIAPEELSVFQNEKDEVVLLHRNDISDCTPFFFEIAEDHVCVMNRPYFSDQIKVTINKEIHISLRQDFLPEQIIGYADGETSIKIERKD